ncbi:hypothetical protein DFH29DRAFT_108883 [Suillus ampliporus]|nr:hypothetical protein DFH29DRAFT_108883 [Suillus ampliporus]
MELPRSHGYLPRTFPTSLENKNVDASGRVIPSLPLMSTPEGSAFLASPSHPPSSNRQIRGCPNGRIGFGDYGLYTWMTGCRGARKRNENPDGRYNLSPLPVWLMNATTPDTRTPCTPQLDAKPSILQPSLRLNPEPPATTHAPWASFTSLQLALPHIKLPVNPYVISGMDLQVQLRP